MKIKKICDLFEPTQACSTDKLKKKLFFLYFYASHILCVFCEFSVNILISLISM